MLQLSIKDCNIKKKDFILYLLYRQTRLPASVRLRYRELLRQSGHEYIGRQLHSIAMHPCCHLADNRPIGQGS